mmetsp:Transcript_32812/g.82757  ORF Transcript_32812/g.82757 Transcript_32812/m.82757 type:complete len:281 (-) Transcript_32812:246-1088(-)
MMFFPRDHCNLSLPGLPGFRNQVSERRRLLEEEVEGLLRHVLQGGAIVPPLVLVGFLVPFQVQVRPGLHPHPRVRRALRDPGVKLLVAHDAQNGICGDIVGKALADDRWVHPLQDGLAPLAQAVDLLLGHPPVERVVLEQGEEVARHRRHDEPHVREDGHVEDVHHPPEAVVQPAAQRPGLPHQGANPHDRAPGLATRMPLAVAAQRLAILLQGCRYRRGFQCLGGSLGRRWRCRNSGGNRVRCLAFGLLRYRCCGWSRARGLHRLRCHTFGLHSAALLG